MERLCSVHISLLYRMFYIEYIGCTGVMIASY